MSQRSSFETFMQQHSHIRYVTPDAPEYAILREAYILDSPAVPFAIVRPRDAEDVATLVSWATSEGVGITVRSGGHDLFGRCFAQDALAIDMRDIDFITVDSSGSSATIGGGILAFKLAEELSKHHLATAFGSFATVGYVGWATHGGYGALEANYGLGVDQIIGATLVNPQGELVTADTEMLEAIRGGGGCLGVIVDLTVKTYPLKEVLGGVIVYKSQELSATLHMFSSGYKALAKNGLPKSLGIQQSVVNTPFGKALAVGFLWSSDDIETGRQWLDQVTPLGGEVALNTVKATTTPEWMAISTELPPKSAYGGNCTISVKEMTDEVVAVMAQEFAKMPDDPATLFSAHQLRGPSAAPRAGSVFSARTPHYVFEFIGTTSSPDRAQESWLWVTGFRDALRKTDPENLLETSYISLTPPAEARCSTIYGSQWQRLVELKNRYDPRNIFCYSLAQFN
ncbi:uncharacterized protein JN550_000535 [Neoarthrinium moseri]|uniref:uncharacterized protein n=1 Tax=Neoarthrinium moseri TaxID=1658444 RepID=UPI001FDE2E74|nr:uncharacterized protein JN550_000535 [Neoarthrinium moseri]KAI1878353.1 hypothetical protein JN550_000535 [Neoarthrinium moseri]